jgi:hypothetical protein
MRGDPGGMPGRLWRWETRLTQHRIGDLLVELGFITRQQLALALAEQGRRGQRLGEVLLGLRFIDHRQLRQALAEQWFRWFFGTVGSAFVLLQSPTALAETARGVLTVSATVVNKAAVAAPRLEIRTARDRSSAAASIEVSCAAGGLLRGGLESAVFDPAAPAGGRAGPGTPRAAEAKAVPCGTEPRQLSIPVDAGARDAAANPVDRLVLVISF